MAKMVSKMKGKMPPPSKDGEGADPMLEIDDTEDGAGDGDVDSRSRNDSPDAGASERTIARGKDGTLSETGEGDEGSPDHEELEGKSEKAAEADKLADCSDDDLLHELKRRGHPAGEHLDASKGVDEQVKGKTEDTEEW